MPPEGSNLEKNELLNETQDDKNKVHDQSEVIISQPDKKREEFEEVQLPSKPEEAFDCLTGFALCCNALEQCWLAVFSCAVCCDGHCCIECINGTCEGFTQCLEGCGECCISCCQ